MQQFCRVSLDYQIVTKRREKNVESVAKKFFFNTIVMQSSFALRRRILRYVFTKSRKRLVPFHALIKFSNLVSFDKIGPKIENFLLYHAKANVLSILLCVHIIISIFNNVTSKFNHYSHNIINVILLDITQIENILLKM